MYEPPDPALTATVHPPPESLERLVEGGGAAVLIVRLTGRVVSPELLVVLVKVTLSL
jgi:hypothetical protein